MIRVALEGQGKHQPLNGGKEFVIRNPLEWGDALRILERSGAIAQAVLTKIYRQRIPGLREAIKDLSKGRTAEGFDKLDKFGVIHEIANDARRLTAIAEKHIEALAAQRSSLIIAPTHGECRAIAKDGVEKQLPLDQAQKFSVFAPQKITLSIGDRIRFTKNIKHRGQKFLNNELRTVVGVDEGKIVFDKGEIVPNGKGLHIDQGIAVTSHASQAKTVDQVIVSVPVRSFSQANQAQFYVSMSRARSTMLVFTDSKVALRDAVTRPSRRLSFWELGAAAEKERALQLELDRQRRS